MIEAELIRSGQDRLYAFASTRPKMSSSLRALTFGDIYSCTGFVRKLDAPQSSWLRLANTYDSFSDWRSHHQHSSIEDFIARLILQGRVNVYPVNLHAVTIAAKTNNPLASLLGFVEPSALLVRPIIKQWKFTQQEEVASEINRLNLQVSDYAALAEAFNVPLGTDKAAELSECLLKGTLLLVALPRSGSVSREHKKVESSPARLTTPPSSTLIKPVQTPSITKPASTIAAQVKSLKLAAVNGAAFCEKCNGVAPARSPALPACATKVVSAQALALKQAAAHGYAYCERCPTRAAAS